MKPLALLSALVVAGLASAATPGAPQLPREQQLPTETLRGYVSGEFNIWGQWNNQPKVFDLADDMVARRRTWKLALPSHEMYREVERVDGMAVQITAIPAKREDAVWYVVLSLEVLP